MQAPADLTMESGMPVANDLTNPAVEFHGGARYRPCAARPRSVTGAEGSLPPQTFLSFRAFLFLPWSRLRQTTPWLATHGLPFRCFAFVTALDRIKGIYPLDGHAGSLKVRCVGSDDATKSIIKIKGINKP